MLEAPPGVIAGGDIGGFSLDHVLGKGAGLGESQPLRFTLTFPRRGCMVRKTDSSRL
jgi:hypothetical protein